MELPDSVMLKPTGNDPNKLGVWCRKAIPKGARFGPYVGIIRSKFQRSMNRDFVWEVVNLQTSKILHYVDATDPKHSNWLRYVRCAETTDKQNTNSSQHNGEIYYTAARSIKPGEELLIGYSTEDFKVECKARRRPSRARPSPRLRARKQASPPKPVPGEVDKPPESKSSRENHMLAYFIDNALSATRRDSPAFREAMGSFARARELQAKQHFRFQFHLHPANRLPSRRFSCEVCGGIYRRPFSLKRHFMRNHINYLYLADSDIESCRVNVALQKRLYNDDLKLCREDEVRSTMDALLVSVQRELDEGPVYPALFRCHVCFLLYDSVTALRSHFPSHRSDGDLLQCAHCPMKFLNLVALTKHQDTHGLVRPDKQEPEDAISDVDVAREKENQPEHKPAPPEQPSKAKARSRPATANRALYFACPLCPRQFADERSMIRHRRSEHAPLRVARLDSSFTRQLNSLRVCEQVARNVASFIDGRDSHIRYPSVHFVDRSLRQESDSVPDELRRQVKQTVRYLVDEVGFMLDPKEVPAKSVLPRPELYQPSFLCSWCNEELSSLEQREAHFTGTHRHIDHRVSGDLKLFPPQLDPLGLVSSAQIAVADEFQCTRCLATFSEADALREHVFECKNTPLSLTTTQRDWILQEAIRFVQLQPGQSKTVAIQIKAANSSQTLLVQLEKRVEKKQAEASALKRRKSDSPDDTPRRLSPKKAKLEEAPKQSPANGKRLLSALQEAKTIVKPEPSPPARKALPHDSKAGKTASPRKARSEQASPAKKTDAGRLSLPTSPAKKRPDAAKAQSDKKTATSPRKQSGKAKTPLQGARGKQEDTQSSSKSARRRRTPDGAIPKDSPRKKASPREAPASSPAKGTPPRKPSPSPSPRKKATPQIASAATKTPATRPSRGRATGGRKDDEDDEPTTSAKPIGRPYTRSSSARALTAKSTAETKTVSAPRPAPTGGSSSESPASKSSRSESPLSSGKAARARPGRNVRAPKRLTPSPQKARVRNQKKPAPRRKSSPAQRGSLGRIGNIFAEIESVMQGRLEHKLADRHRDTSAQPRASKDEHNESGYSSLTPSTDSSLEAYPGRPASNASSMIAAV